MDNTGIRVDGLKYKLYKINSYGKIHLLTIIIKFFNILFKINEIIAIKDISISRAKIIIYK